MRSAPARAMLARSSSMNGRKASARKILGHRLEDGVPLERERLGAAERGEGDAIAAALELAKQDLEQRTLDRRDALVVDQRRGAQCREVFLEARIGDASARLGALRETIDALDVEIEQVEEQAARRRVRTEALWRLGEHRVQRVEPDRLGAQRPGAARQLGQIGEIADAPAARRAHAVELHRDAPDALLGLLAQARR